MYVYIEGVCKSNSFNSSIKWVSLRTLFQVFFTPIDAPETQAEQEKMYMQNVRFSFYLTNLSKVGLCQQNVAQLPCIKINKNLFSEFVCCYLRAEVRTNERGEDNGRSFPTFNCDPSRYQ
jgi:hypothetical protein